MANQKLQELTADTSLTDSDIIYKVNDPTGTPLDRKITWANVKASLKTYFDTLYQSLHANLTAIAGLTSAADKFPYFTGSGTAALADLPAAMRTFLTTPSSANLAALVNDDLFSLTDAELAAIAGLTSAANKFPYFTGSGAAALADLSAAMRTFLTTPSSANLAALVNDDLFSLTDAELAAIAGLTSAADRLPYFTGLGTAALATFTAAGRALVDDADAATQRTTLGLGSIATLAAPSGTVVGTSDTQTLTNKRVNPRVSSETSSATPTINTDNVDAHSITALAAAITSMTTNLSGTPVNFQKLIIRIKDNGTARAITWGASFEAKGVALPTTTVINKVLTVGFIYDTVTSKWGCVASAQEA